MAAAIAVFVIVLCPNITLTLSIIVSFTLAAAKAGIPRRRHGLSREDPREKIARIGRKDV